MTTDSEPVMFNSEIAKAACIELVDFFKRESFISKVAAVADTCEYSASWKTEHRFNLLTTSSLEEVILEFWKLMVNAEKHMLERIIDLKLATLIELPADFTGKAVMIRMSTWQKIFIDPLFLEYFEPATAIDTVKEGTLGKFKNGATMISDTYRPPYAKYLNDDYLISEYAQYNIRVDLTENTLELTLFHN